MPSVSVDTMAFCSKFLQLLFILSLSSTIAQTLTHSRLHYAPSLEHERDLHDGHHQHPEGSPSFVSLDFDGGQWVLSDVSAYQLFCWNYVVCVRWQKAKQKYKLQIRCNNSSIASIVWCPASRRLDEQYTTVVTSSAWILPSKLMSHFLFKPLQRFVSSRFFSAISTSVF